MAKLLVLMMVFAGMCATAWAKPLLLHYGVNDVDINGDGVKDVIVRSRWDITDKGAGDHYLVMVYTHPFQLKQESVFPVEVGFFDKPEEAFKTSELPGGALSAIEFSLDDRKWLQMTRYSREENGDHWRSQRVTKTVYRLVKSDDVPTGIIDVKIDSNKTPYAFQQVSKMTSKEKFYDVRDAIDKE